VTSDGIDAPIIMQCSVEIGDGRIHIDWSGSSPASRYGINVVLNYTHAYSTYAIHCLLNAQVPNNSGSLRPITVSAPEGCILNAAWPSPLAARHVIGHFLPMAIIRALSGLPGTEALAEGSANIWLAQYTGRKATGEPFTFTMSATGGMGARSDKDGLSTTAFPSGVMGIPTEIVETASPLVILERSLLPDSGGAGQYRGGLGQRIRLTIDSDYEATASVLLDRVDHAAAGTAGGAAGRPGRAWIDPGHRRLGKERVTIGRGDTIVLELPGGGGYGSPTLRDRAALRRDVREGYVTADGLRADYGLGFDDLGEGVR
jgi:N-methylhydantoinase B